MNVIYSSDNNYARHVGISITSLYDHNQDVETVNVYLIDDEISEENHKKLDAVAKKHNFSIHVPIRDLDSEAIEKILYGTGSEKYKMRGGMIGL